MRGIVRVHGGLLILEEGGPINGMYRFHPHKKGDTWNGKFGDERVAGPAPTQPSETPPKSWLREAAAALITTAQQSVKSAIAAIAPSTRRTKLKPESPTAAAAAAAPSHPPAGGVKKRSKAVSGYTKRRKTPPSEQVLATRRQAADKKAEQLAAWKSHLQSLPPKQKQKQKQNQNPKSKSRANAKAEANSPSVQEHDPDAEVLISKHEVPRPGLKLKPRTYAKMLKPTSGRRACHESAPAVRRTYFWVKKNSRDHKRAIAAKVVHDTSALFYDDHAYHKFELAPQPAVAKKR
jgi:hypothetical protein